MGKRHAAAAAGIAQAQVDERLREAEGRRNSAERERQLLTSYLGSQEQVSGTGRFANASPELLKYTQRYSVDQRALADVLAAGSQVKRQEDPFQGADNRVRGGLSIADYGQGFATRANDLLAQAEAAARAGDFAGADRLFAQAQSVIGGVSPEVAEAYNLGGGEESNAAIRASSTEGRIVGRQLLAAQQLQDPNSETSQGLRGRLLNPALGAIDSGTQNVIGEINQAEVEAQKVIDENTRNAERAIASERGQIDGEIRQRGAGGVGVNARAQLALQSRAGAEAARARAEVYTSAAAEQASIASQSGLARAEVYARESAMRASLISQVDLYLNEFAKRMAEDSVALSQEWVNGTAGVRDQFQAALDQFDIIGIQLANQRAQMLAQVAENARREADAKKSVRREALFGFATGSLAIATIFGGGTPNLGSSSGLGASNPDIGAAPELGGEAGGLIDGGDQMPIGSSFGQQTGGGGGGGLGSKLGSLLAFV